VPTTALEAMACGTPVCATPVGGIPDVVHDGETGWLLTEASTAEMAARIEDVVRNSDELAATSQTARSYVKKNCSFDVVVKAYRSVFTEAKQT